MARIATTGGRRPRPARGSGTVPGRPARHGGGTGGVGQQRREAQHPPVDRDVVDLNAAFDQELFDVTVGQAEA